MFRSNGNHFHFEGRLSGDPLPVTAALHNVIHKQGYGDITLDFRATTFISPTFMVPLVTVCRAYRREKVHFEFVMPDDRRTAALISNANWASIVDPEKYESKTTDGGRHMSAVQFFSNDEHDAAVNRSLDLILQAAEGIDRNRLKALEWALNEISDNVLNHAESPVGGVMQVVSFSQAKRVEFYVCDAGITIPRSLRQGRPEIRDDTTALRQAIEEGITKNSTTNQGNGLYGTFKCCEVSGGEFEILSGVVRLKHRPGEVSVGRSPIPYPGTFVRASINYDMEKLLEEALVFKGRSYSPGYDYVDRMYQADTNHILFKMKTEVSSFGSRESGRLARTKIENLMDRRRTPIEFDFSGMHLISSSFADEVFGRLFLDLGPLGFTQLCSFKNVDPTIQGLIDRAIAQRMRL